jgi:hypothetical protein
MKTPITMVGTPERTFSVRPIRSASRRGANSVLKHACGQRDRGRDAGDDDGADDRVLDPTAGLPERRGILGEEIDVDRREGALGEGDEDDCEHYRRQYRGGGCERLHDLTRQLPSPGSAAMPDERICLGAHRCPIRR